MTLYVDVKTLCCGGYNLALFNFGLGFSWACAEWPVPKVGLACKTTQAGSFRTHSNSTKPHGTDRTSRAQPFTAAQSGWGGRF